MLTCLPQGICSWTFVVLELPGAKVAFFLIGEQGTIALDGVTYAIGRSGIISPTWTLSRDGQVLASATVGGIVRAVHWIESADGVRELQSAGIFRSDFVLTQNGVAVGIIAPAHPLTRRAVIECDSSVPVLDQLFAFWLVALRWRRMTNSGRPGTGS